MRTVSYDRPLRTVWTLANAEACLAGSSTVNPQHLLLAFLKVVDGVFEEDAARLGIAGDDIAAAQAIAVEGRELIGLSPEDLTATRRKVRRLVRPDEIPRAIAPLPHSLAIQSVLEAAARQAKGRGLEEVGAIDVLRQLLAEQVGGGLAALTASALATSPPVPGGAMSPEMVAPAQQRDLSAETGIPFRDLTALARQGRLAPVVGRRKEIKSLARYLQRTTKRNVMLIGEAGVGKTAIVEGLAQLLVDSRAPGVLQGVRVLQLDVADLVSGTSHRGDLEQRLRRLLDAATSDPKCVLFLDEIHLVMQAGGGSGAVDVASMLKPALTRSDFRCIGATTTAEFERHIKDDAAFQRRFQLLRVAEPTEEQAVEMCRSWAKRIEEIQQVVIDDAAIETAVSLTARLVRGRALPDKAIDALENAAAAATISSLSFREVAVTKTLPRIGPREVEAAIKEEYGVSPTLPAAMAPETLVSELRRAIVGQDAAAGAIGDVIGRLRYRPERAAPMGVLVFSGPAGTGKTLAADVLSRVMFDAVPGRFNLAELVDRHDLSRLVGAAPGFIGHDRQGMLFQFTERNPQGVILLHGWTRTDPVVRDYFLQIFQSGEAMDSRGRRTDFRPYLFVITGDFETAGGAGRRGIGFKGPGSGPEGDAPTMPDAILDLQNVADAVIMFASLKESDYGELLNRRLEGMGRQIEARSGLALEVSDEARRHLLRVCMDPRGGPAAFLSALERLLDALGQAPLPAVNPGAALRMLVVEGNLVFAR
jgi:ATP-dependent Clp protease ATP-binding subunit ClpC